MLPFREGEGVYHGRFVASSDYRKIAIAVWNFYCYNDGGSPDIWRRWFFDEPLLLDDVRARHEFVLQQLQAGLLWDDGKFVHGSPIGGTVQLIVAPKKSLQWRVVGMHGFGQRRFVIVDFLYHKGSRYKPNGIKSQIEARRDELLRTNFGGVIHCEPPRSIERV